jgi:hypothetical protein
MSAHKDGAVAVVGEWPPQKNQKKKKKIRNNQGQGRHKHEPLKEGNGDTLLGYSAQTALRREQCDS